jgi:hypothetical protein
MQQDAQQQVRAQLEARAVAAEAEAAEALQAAEAAEGRAIAVAAQAANAGRVAEAQLLQAQQTAEAAEEKAAAAVAGTVEAQAELSKLRTELEAAMVDGGAADLVVLAKAKWALDKEKLENYLKEALQACQKKYLVAINQLQHRLQEKEKMVGRYQEEVRQWKEWRDQMNAVHKREERLVMSNFYEIGEEMLRRLHPPR